MSFFRTFLGHKMLRFDNVSCFRFNFTVMEKRMLSTEIYCEDDVYGEDFCLLLTKLNCTLIPKIALFRMS